AHPLPDLAALQEALYGPAPDSSIPPDAEIVARCDEAAGCTLSHGRLTVTLPQGWAMTEPLFVRATADHSPTDFPMTEFYGPAPGEALRLNPHQWLASNGPCIDSAAGPLCWFSDAPDSIGQAAQVIAPTLTVAEDHAVIPDAPCGQTLCRFQDAATGLDIQLPQGWSLRQGSREGGVARAQFTDGRNLIMLIGADGWSPENGPCLDSAAGPLCFWAESDDDTHIAAAVIAANLSLLDPGLGDAPGGSVTLAPPPWDILAGSGGFFPITLDASEGFQGRVTLHAPGGAEVFRADAAWLLGAQDQVLPVPETP
ncbi:MAG: hypothetical protein ACK4YU_12970, partial [Paracoccus sp. (in: a-proteobacteria)]